NIQKDTAPNALITLIYEIASQVCFPRSRSTGDKNRAAPIDTLAAEHGVKAGNASRDSLIAHLVLEPDRGKGQDVEAFFVDQERVFVRAVGGAAIFHDPQAARGNLVEDTMIQQDHAIGDVFLEPATGQGAVATLAS